MIDLKTLTYLHRVHQAGATIVLVTGVFDILHSEHKAFLEAAKVLGGVLLVGLESDSRVRQLKGVGRPVNTLARRISQLSNWDIADWVFGLPEDFSTPQQHEDLIRLIKPAFLAVSSHTGHLREKRQIVEKYGGELRIVRPFNPSVSTTQILQQIDQN